MENPYQPPAGALDPPDRATLARGRVLARKALLCLAAMPLYKAAQFSIAGGDPHKMSAPDPGTPMHTAQVITWVLGFTGVWLLYQALRTPCRQNWVFFCALILGGLAAAVGFLGPGLLTIIMLGTLSRDKFWVMPGRRS